MESAKGIIEIYRNIDDYQRYLVSNKKRVQELKKLAMKNTKFFGKKVLDIGAGGGILGVILKGKVDRYLGIDVNPDVVNASKDYLEKLGLELILGDARKIKLKEEFDTVVIVGNVLGHLTTKDFIQIMKNVSSLTSAGTHLIVDYRDWIKMYFTGKWEEIHVSEKGIRVTMSIDSKSGEVKMMNVKFESGKIINLMHTLWSPFILEAIMNLFGWELVKREEEPEWGGGWFEVYERNKD